MGFVQLAFPIQILELDFQWKVLLIVFALFVGGGASFRGFQLHRGVIKPLSSAAGSP